MRGLVATHYYAPHLGGIEVVAQAQVATLLAHGFDVTVLTTDSLDDGARAPSHTDGGAEVLRLRAANYLQQRVGIPYPLVGLRFALAAWRSVGAADVVHVHDVFYLTSQITAFCAWLRRRPLFVTQHVGVVQHQSRMVRALQRLVYSTSGRAMFRLARAVIVYNPTVASTVAKYGGPRTRVVEMRNGVDTTAFHPADAAERDAARVEFGLPPDKPIVLFVGRLVAKKGADLVVAAADPQYLTVLVGGGNLVPARSHVPNVRMLGGVPRHRMPDLYRAADIFVLPTVDEPFTLALQEALASGLAVITTPDDAYEGPGLASLSIVARDAAALRARILELVADPEARSNAGEAARELALARFGWEGNVTRLLDVYRDALTPSSE